ncbi:receptor-type tyrosine-protein phosphatase epsilon-like [Gigantopelta aegis]|uniref:receptor-type tyrosine-protein phosphatase epsilon-like n=1 Tax=Gigantopelta aegis TaxID=1735272 RepID=UPI001B88E322|nr:receptor-type tyrosine-protein phosphatase epsilon-like [Gigantopelta aegis]
MECLISGRYQCHCVGGCTGNIEDYDCLESCENGYYGRYCQNENVALNKRASQSTICIGYEGEASLAVDGNTTTTFGMKGTSHAFHNRLKGLHITIDNRTCRSWENTKYPSTKFSVICNQTGQVVKFEVLRMCTDFWYGEDCNKTCNCRNQTEVCDKKTGKCTACPGGWTGDACVECTDLWYGGHCHRTCICRNETEVCNKTTGKCTECPDGWSGDVCDVCADFWYGEDCNKTCKCRNETEVCDKKTGRCTDCPDRWMGDACDIASLNTVTLVVAGGISVAAVKRETARSKQDVFTDQHALATRNEVPMVDLEHDDLDTDDEADNLLSQPCVNVEENEYVNYINTKIPVETLCTSIQDKEFKKEYSMLPFGLLAPHNIGNDPVNKKKNRYLTTFPYDHSRVQLKITETQLSDYINANYIDGYKKPKAYIATQGPLPLTTDDFWRMIWEQDVSKIVMLANLVEDGKNKCAKYWPELNSVKTVGKLDVTSVNVTDRADYITREFRLSTDQGATTQIVKMFHFTTWPDHGVPSAPALLGFWKQVKKDSESCGPVVVHCSAGIGRTGTFIGLDYLVNEAKDTNVVNIFVCVRTMRDNRVNMVQTVGQYQFLYEVLLDAICSMDTFYTVDSLNDSAFNENMNHSAQKRRLQQEFNDLTRLKKPVSQKDIDNALSPENRLKNRNLSIIPVSYHRVMLTTLVPGTNDYINAVTLPSCTNRKGFLVTQLPLELTVIDFWRMVYEQDCHTIVCLSGKDTEVLKKYKYWPKVEDMATIRPFTVENQSTVKLSSEITEISLTLTTDAVHENTHKKILKLFVLNNWSEKSGLPSDNHELLLFLDRLERRREETGKSPIIVQCMDGAKQSGLFCVLSNIIEKLKLEKDVDIFVTVRELQCIRPQLVESSEQYQYCYTVVREHLRNMDIVHIA